MSETDLRQRKSQIMKKYLLIIIIICLQKNAVQAQECRDFTPVEQGLYTHLLGLFDGAVKDKCNTDDWVISLKSPSDINSAVNQKMIPVRPFSPCGFERLNIGIVFPWFQKLNDSIKAYDDLINPIAARLMSETETDVKVLRKKN